MSFNNKQTKQPIDKVNMALDDIIKRDKRPGNNSQKGGGKKPFGMLNKSRAIQKNRRPQNGSINNNNNNRQMNRSGPQGRSPRRTGGSGGGPRPQQVQQRRPRPQGGRGLANFNLNKRLNNNNANRGRRGPQQPRFGGAQIKNRLSIGGGNGANRNNRPQQVKPAPIRQNAALKGRLGGGVARGGVARKPLQQPIRKANAGNKIAMQTARKNVLKAKKLLAQKKRILKQTTQRLVANPVKNGQGAKRVNKMVRVNVRNNTVRPRGKPQVATKRFMPIVKRKRGPTASSGRTVLL